MSSTPTVDRFRYPWRRMVPGDDHIAILHFVNADDTDRDVSASTFTMVMHDGFTAEPVATVTYTIDDTNAAAGEVVATAPIPADLDPANLYELRFRQDDQLVCAGPVMFAPATIPVVPAP